MAGWEPKVTTTYRYDDEGRVVEAVTTTEPEWSAEDRGWAAALDLVEARACRGCGQPRHRVWGAETATGLAARHAWCMGCRDLVRHSEAVIDNDRGSDGKGRLPREALHVWLDEKSE